MSDWILWAVLIALIGGAACYIRREKKRGAKCIGCPGCPGGGCGSCACNPAAGCCAEETMK